MKKILLMLTTVIALTVLCMSSVSAAAANEISLTAPDDVMRTETFNLVFTEEYAITDLAGISIDMVFDPDVVNINSVTVSNFAGDEVVGEIDNTAGTVEYCWVLMGAEVGESHPGGTAFVTVNCTAVSNGGDTWVVDITNAQETALAVDGKNVRFMYSDSDAAAIEAVVPVEGHMIEFDRKHSDTVSEGQLVRTYYNSSDVRNEVFTYIGATDDTGLEHVAQYESDGTTIAKEYYYHADGSTKSMMRAYTSGLLTQITQYDASEVMTATTFYTQYNSGNVKTQKKTYDASGNLSSLTNYVVETGLREEEYTYQLYQGAAVKELRKGYDASETLIAVTEYDTTGAITKSTEFEGGVKSIVRTYSGGYLVSFTQYDDTGVGLVLSYEYWGGATTPVKKIGRSYDDDGILSALTDFDEQGRTEMTCTYYTNGQEKVKKTYDPATGTVTSTTVYDEDGNIISQS